MIYIQHVCVFWQRHEKCDCQNYNNTAIVIGLGTSLENLVYKLYTDNFFSSPDLCDDLHTKAKGDVVLAEQIEKEYLVSLEENLDENGVT